jgi:hypothetical protein
MSQAPRKVVEQEVPYQRTAIGAERSSSSVHINSRSCPIAAAAFSSKWATDEIPGLGRMGVRFAATPLGAEAVPPLQQPLPRRGRAKTVHAPMTC